MKQEALAQALDANQQAILALDNSETIDEGKLIAVVKALGVNIEALKNFSDKAAINYFNNFYYNSAGTFNKHFKIKKLSTLCG